MRDVTEFRRLELELRKANEELEQRVEERTEELRQINQQLRIELTERKRMEDALIFVAQRGWQAGGENFLDALAQHLGESLAMDYVVIDRTDINPEIAETVALYAKGAIVPNMRYALKGTPCENVMGRRLCVYSQGVRQLFPEDTLLAEMGVESYIGIPLWDSSGRPIGLIALMDSKPLPDTTSATQLLQLVAIRAAAELERGRIEEERSQNSRYFESMDKVNRAIQGATDLEGMLSDVLDAVLTIFDCDRAFLLYPCDPEAPSWSVPMERCKPEYPGVLELGIEVPTSRDVAQTFRTLLEAAGPVTFGPGTQNPLPADASERFGFKSFISLAFRPKIGSPWQFGLHQCSRVRNWTTEEERLFREIARRLADGLNTMLVYRNLQESEKRYRLVFKNSPVSIWEEDFSGVKDLLDGLKQEGVTGIEAHFEQHPEIIRQCAQLVKVVDVNEAALDLHGAASKEDLLEGLIETFTEESFDTFREELVCLWNGADVMIRDAVVRTLTGVRRDVTVYFAVCPGYEKTFGKVIVSLVDITERKRAGEALHLQTVELEEEVAERQMAQEALQEKALLLEEEIETRQRAQEELEQLNVTLELHVKERTNELEQKNAELHKMNRLFVGRELKMVELKERIRKLEHIAEAGAVIRGNESVIWEEKAT